MNRNLEKVEFSADQLRFIGPDLSCYPITIYEGDKPVYTKYGDLKELNREDCKFGTVCYVTHDRCPDMDLFVIIDYNVKKDGKVSDSEGQLKVIFPQVTMVDGKAVLGKDKLDHNVAPGSYQPHLINLPMSWYIGCASFDKNMLDALDVPLGYFEHQES